MRFKVTCTSRNDHVVTGVEKLLPLLEEGEQLEIQFFEGRGALKCWLVGSRPTLERGFCKIFDAFCVKGDDGMLDHHRDVTKYLELMLALENKNPTSVVRGWRLKGFYSLISAVWEIRGQKAPWNRHGVPWQAVKDYCLTAWQ